LFWFGNISNLCFIYLCFDMFREIKRHSDRAERVSKQLQENQKSFEGNQQSLEKYFQLKSKVKNKYDYIMKYLDLQKLIEKKGERQFDRLEHAFENGNEIAAKTTKNDLIRIQEQFEEGMKELNEIQLKMGYEKLNMEFAENFSSQVQLVLSDFDSRMKTLCLIFFFFFFFFLKFIFFFFFFFLLKLNFLFLYFFLKTKRK